MKIKTADLIGPALDWAVAKCEKALLNWPNYTALPYYSTDWSQGGPIIEREKIALKFTSACSWHAAIEWLDEPSYLADGPTPLIAAMRCYVASKLGEEVDIPDELC